MERIVSRIDARLGTSLLIAVGRNPDKNRRPASAKTQAKANSGQVVDSLDLNWN